MHVHLDPLGGVAGDMFVAAMLDAWPDLAKSTIASVRAAGFGDEIGVAHLRHDDGVLTGSRFDVRGPKEALGKQNGRAHHHHHTHWADLRASLEGGALADSVKTHALGIFTELAKAEAAVHGKDIETVAFHEVGNWDSIADIVAAAALLDTLAIESWSIGSLPIGSGRVDTAHGELPVPAPATVLLLKGFAFHDDGRPGERVTPTGAALLRHLSPASTIGLEPRMLARCGYGFGTRRLEGMSNVLRLLAFEPTVRSSVEDETARTDVGQIVEPAADQPIALGSDRHA